MKSCVVGLALMFVTHLTVMGQIDSVGVFKSVRTFSDANKKELSVLFTTSSIAASGCVNAAFYRPETAALGIHECTDILHYSVYGLAYVSGLDPVESLGASFVANFIFKAFIAYAYTGKIVNPDEDCSYTSWGWSRRKVFCGRTRWAELGIGVLLLKYKVVI